MPTLIISLEVLLGVVILGMLAVIVATYLRRRKISGGKTLSVCGIRDSEATRWRVGLLRMGTTELSWYSMGGLTTKPTHVFPRGTLHIDPPLALPPGQTISVLANAQRVPSRYLGVTFDLALQPEDYRALRAWLESAPPSFNTDLTIS